MKVYLKRLFNSRKINDDFTLSARLLCLCPPRLCTTHFCRYAIRHHNPRRRRLLTIRHHSPRRLLTINHHSPRRLLTIRHQSQKATHHTSPQSQKATHHTSPQSQRDTRHHHQSQRDTHRRSKSGPESAVLARR